MRWMILLVCVGLVPSAMAQSEIFHGWSKDGTYLVYETHGANELVELHFCQTTEAKPTWPKELDSMEKEESQSLSCIHFLDPNKAPYQWKSKLVLPAPATKQGAIEILHELVTDGETPGFVLQSGDKKQSCYASGTREDSKLQKTWFHPSGKLVAAQIDGNFRHCVVTLKPPAATPPGKKK